MSVRRPLGFSTLGVPGASAGDIVALATRVGFDAVELRIGDDEQIGLHSSTAERAQWRDAFDGAGVRILSVNTYLATSSTRPDLMVDLEASIQLAHDVGAGGVRLFVGDEPYDGGGLSPGERRSVRLLDGGAESADHAGVDLLLETHDSHPTAARVRRILDALESPVGRRRVGVIWDAVHSWAAGEGFGATRAGLAGWLAWVQVKDVRRISDPAPVALGAGSFPIGECCSALDADTLVVLEWERRWHSELSPLERAASGMRAWLS
ncbi:Xylose isomerase domain protein TIM barrel [Beutenbergia cavernae DSM 12333]|uniref:Xylose isomerase domain protein TIM barrel n=1 Tax=Beutenbergia cavernae (strain ATCC BAA-8 / DSM 12333 / CCUG 43141 / JCM 11478 / NBRC 16432 / NCIMB 13614 / HKI 0122) TaxID=471853 RepID=C5BZK5_BEUC1|nr:sugar phosphate isomerase/epimerase family protein [Beutenbergia cavernae]ACQ79177.1 Xylose isomerase domain protein TIM barrel [Beutenbergia cavernae DSM 12333]